MEENIPPQQRIEYLRQAAKYNPFDHTSRMIAASIMAQFAINSHDPSWLNAAKIEIGKVLQTESTDAILLLRGIQINLELGDAKQAQAYFNQLQRVDRKSPLIGLVAQSHQQGRPPVAANP